MIELIAIGILATLNVALLAGHILYVRESNKDKTQLLNAVLAKTPEQFRDLELANKVEIVKSVPTVPDLVSEADLTDEEFLKNIAGEENGKLS